MGTYHDATWAGDEAGYSRRERWGGAYRWYEPTPLSELDFMLDAGVAADVSRAERALFGDVAPTSANMEGIARLLLRSEAVASSRIEGLSIGAGRLARAELQEREPDSVRYDRRAAAVLGNIRAMETAVASAAESGQITVETLRDVHRSLVEHTDEEPIGGRIRDVQNWVGGSSYSPLGATYVPPAPEAVPDLLDDLVAYANRSDVPPVVQAALCHSQFESIHPFLDGNGRTGRALIQIILMRSGVTREAMPPISLALATDRKGYMSALAGMQGWVSSQQGHVAYNEWVSTFAGATIAACADRTDMERDLSDMRAGWEKSLGGHPRSGATVSLLLGAVQAMPYFTVRSMVEATGRTYNAVNGAISALVSAGIVEETTKGKRNRVFRAPQVIEEFEIVERRIASPARDTLVARPARPTPVGRPRKRPSGGIGGDASPSQSANRSTR